VVVVVVVVVVVDICQTALISRNDIFMRQVP
jgi:hypothetical protein